MVENIAFQLSFEDTRAELVASIQDRLDVVKEWLVQLPEHSDKISCVFISGVELLQDIDSLDFHNIQRVAKDCHIFIRAYEQLAESVLQSRLDE